MNAETTKQSVALLAKMVLLCRTCLVVPEVRQRRRGQVSFQGD